jgi:RNA polymerase sigma factor (sigma-70 family)
MATTPEQGRYLSKREEIADLYRQYGAAVNRRCRYFLHNEQDALDASQEVFVKAMKNMDRFRQESSHLTWLIKIASNHCLNVIASNRAQWRKKYRDYAKHVNEIESKGTDRLERMNTVRALLGQLDKETAQIAVHYYVDEMTQKEISNILNISQPTIRKRLKTFLRIAQKELQIEVA